MVKQWQEMFFDNHIKEVPLTGPDYVKLAHAYGLGGIKVTHQEDVSAALRQAQEYDGPFLIEFVVDPSVNLYPMVPPGGGLGDTLEDPLTRRSVSGG
jgi:acetolactate synthase-1/2/3 large subunit